MYLPLSDLQAKHYVDSAQLSESVRQISHEYASYKGGMHWKRVKERDYLYRILDRKGNGSSLGPRGPKTEKILQSFTARKVLLQDQLKHLKNAYKVQCSLNFAIRLGSVPNPVGDVIEALDQSGLTGGPITVIGTNAMHAYEYLGGVKFMPATMATIDIDLLGDHKQRLSLLVSESVEPLGVLGILQTADKSFVRDELMQYRARSKSGFMVDLICPTPKPPWAIEPDPFAQNDLIATEIEQMSWLISAPRVEQPVVCVDGRTVPMPAPDPRAFAIYKAWLSTRPDREPVKRARDLAQARAVAALVDDRLHHLNDWTALKSFPQDIVVSSLELMKVELHAPKLTDRPRLS